MTAKAANDIYDLRDCSEKQYSLMKTQLGDSVFRANNMHRIAVREVIAFAASIIRHRIMRKCRDTRPSIDTNNAIKELNLINMNLIGNDRYQVIHNQCKRQKEIMKLLGITVENLDHIAAYETERFNRRMVHPVQTLAAASPEEQKETKVIRGVPEGSGAKGKGSRKSTMEPSEKQSPESNIKRGPGRPKGSKNKPKSENANATPKRGPGRPKGSKNKPKSDTPMNVEKRGPGRPKGSKNKPKV